MKKILLSLVVLFAALSVNAKKVIAENVSFTFGSAWDWQQIEFPEAGKDATGFTHLIAYIGEATTTAQIHIQVGWNTETNAFNFDFSDATSVGAEYVVIPIAAAGDQLAGMGNFCVMSDAGGAGVITFSEIAYITQEEYDDIHEKELSKPYNEVIKEPGKVDIAGGGFGWNASAWLDKTYSERAKSVVVEIASTDGPIAFVVKFGESDDTAVSQFVGPSAAPQTIVIPMPEGSTYIQQYAFQNMAKDIIGNFAEEGFSANITKVYVTSESVEQKIVEYQDPADVDNLIVVADDMGSWDFTKTQKLAKTESGTFEGVITVEDMFNGEGWYGIGNTADAATFSKNQISVSEDWGVIGKAGDLISGVNNGFKLAAGEYYVIVDLGAKTILFQDPATAINAVSTSSAAKTGKRLENGSVVIYKGGNKYNVAGTLVK